MGERQFKGIWIPKELWLNEDLTLLEKVMLIEIDSLESEEKGCFASNQYFADFFKKSNGRIAQVIKELKDKGYLKVDYIYSGKEIEERRIYINRPPYPNYEEVFNKLKGGIKFSKGGYLENCKDNNISNNNINNIERYIEEIQKFKPVLNSTDYELIKQISNKYSLEELKRAIKVCKDNNAYSIKYLLQVLVNKPKVNQPEWLDKDIKAETIPEEDVKELLGGWKF